MRLLPLDYGIRNLGRSPLRLIAIVIGSMLVVLLMIAAAAFVRGMKKSLSIQSQQENVILLSSGSEESIERSEIDPSSANFLSASVRGIKEKLGISYISPEIHIALILYLSQAHPQEFQAICRGMTSSAFLVHPRVEITEGRAPRAGYNELMIGRLAADKMNIDPQHLALGHTLWFAKREWTIVGKFQAPATVMDAEIWIPLNDLLIATRRGGISCVVVTLDKAEFEDLDIFTKQRVDLELAAIRESDYYASLTRFYRPVQSMIWVTAILVSLAGILGGLNVMYASFSARVREIGMLQCLGFSRLSILISLIQESILATSVGTLLGIVLSLFFLEGQAVRFSMGVFQLVIDPPVLLLGTVAGVGLGFIGAIPPGLRNLKLSMTEALKSI